MALKMGHGSRTKKFLQLIIAILGITFISILYFSNIDYAPFYRKFIPENGSDFLENIDEYFEQDKNLILNGSLKEGYLVWGPGCQIPDIDPYHESIRHLIKKEVFTNCSDLPLLTRISGDQLIYEDHLVSKFTDKHELICYYQRVARGINYTAPDKVFVMSPRKRFNKTFTLEPNEEFLFVECYAPQQKDGKRVYGNMHARVINKQRVKAKLTRKISPLMDDKLSVLLFGIDSISRLNLHRTMPKTVSFLKRHDFLELTGYNKIEDNTFPNLVAVLSGMTMKQLKDKCYRTSDTPQDNCPYLWKNASEMGYITTYAEDEPEISSFHCSKKGFDKQPTDYYLRPFMLAAVEVLDFKKLDLMHVCLGPQLSSDLVMNYTNDLLGFLKQNRSFSLIWMNSFSHNTLNTPSFMDDKMEAFFEDMTKMNDTMNSTMIVFMSDHGMRYGEIRETYVGWLEERLPFIFIWIPEWYRNKYKNKYNNLLVNANRLTTPYDLHMTLRDVIFSKYEKDDSYTCEATSNCKSLFEQVPWNRTCLEAGINGHYCTCYFYRMLSKETTQVRTMVQFVVNKINAILEPTRNSTENISCVNLDVKRIIGVRTRLHNGYHDYVLIFETIPGFAIFEATVLPTNGSFNIIGSISRINAYSNQSHCVNDYNLKKYCFCNK